MSAQQRFARAVDGSLQQFLDEREEVLSAISPDAAALVAQVRSLVSGGKRVRSAFVLWGWHAVTAARPEATRTAGTEEDAEWELAVGVAVAMELFHAAALVHDDIIDGSDTRRGRPSMHRALEGVHRDAEWAGDAAAWGRSAAVLVGDLLLNWADDRMIETCRASAHGDAVHDEYRRMREEVTFGQYLDVLEEVAWIRQDPSTLLDRAHTVAIHKSARYSVERPLALGALLAGADAAQLDALSGYGLPVGLAFQMRDDLLGVFGDPEVTGKPAGDDLREGKRTVLVEIARQRLSPGVRTMLDELLGDPELDERQIVILQDAIQGSEAPARLEALIDRAVGQALERLHEGELSRAAVLELERLADTLARRDR
ncbi:polyprenyl synthetase family protein [Agrococcus sp. SL85]|uniref:polyprenyl synthetase family protein n=1 Tax=Agrococcus sp. SL85 TaxID=2995141 RepID=UPI00226D06B8|nr:polyprenyl synthetase family protein [Agrococcus sp. SL85]WAC66168.1 polyprenyl synthetase family protein [Agrococcus sp. SL85]